MDTHNDPPSKTDQILDLLLDALLERQAQRRAARPASRPTPEAPQASTPSLAPASATSPSAAPVATRPAPAPRTPAPPRVPGPGEAGWEPPARVPAIGMDRLLARFLVVVAALALLVNVPVAAYGGGLARLVPDSASLIIRDGLVLKGTGPDIYMLEDNRLRWISSMDAFEHLGLTWEDVHVVEDAFLRRFEVGAPLHVLVKCEASPHIYRLEGGRKRWIRDIPTLLDEGHAWEDVRFVSCEYLRSLPDGLPIPESAGPAPQP